MAIVARFDVHRAQITFDALDTGTGARRHDTAQHNHSPPLADAPAQISRSHYRLPRAGRSGA
jgi:hypothetical protein